MLTKNKLIFNVCNALGKLVPFVRLRKREKHPWGSVTFTLLVFFTFFKLYKRYQIAQSVL